MRPAIAFIATLVLGAAGPVAVLARSAPATAAPADVATRASAASAVSLAPASVPVTQVSLAPSPPPAATGGAKSSELVARMNVARREHGLSPLERDAGLDAAAAIRAGDMVRLRYFAHYGPAGESAFSALDQVGMAYAIAGENLARNTYPEDVALSVAFDGLMASPTHRANILEPRFERVGVAVVQDGAAWLFVTVFKD